MQTQTFTYNFVQGIDTKTDKDFVLEQFLVLDNCEMENEKIVKTTGYIKLGGQTTLDADSLHQQVFTYNQNLYRIQSNQLQSYRMETDSFTPLNVIDVLTVEGFTTKSNISEVDTRPLVTALYGEYYSYVWYNPTTSNWELYITNYTTQQTLFVNKEFLMGETTAVLDVVGTPNGLFVYTCPDTTLDPAAITETIINFIDFTTTVTVSFETDLFFYQPPESDNYPAYVTWYYLSFVCKYINGQVFLLYRTGTETDCIGKLVIRSLSGETAFTDPAFADPMDLTGVQGTLNIGIFALSSDNFPYILAMFGYKFYLINVATYGQYADLFPFQYTEPDNEIFQTFNIGFLSDTKELVMLKHNPVQTQTEGTQVCPFINKFDLNTGTWSEYTNTCDARYNDGNYYLVRGSCSLAGGVVGLNGKAYFAVSIFSYLLSLDEDDTVIYQTPINERRCTIYLVDSDYNVVQSILSYNGDLFVQDDASYVVSVPRFKVNAISNTDVNVVYAFFYNQNIYVTTEQVDITKSIIIRNVSSVIPPDFFYTDYNTAAYFGNARLTEIANTTVSEQGFFDFPQVFPQESETDGDLTALGNYAYVAVYIWSNGAGDVVRSAPSIDQLITLTDDTSSVDLYWTPYPFFTQKEDVTIEFYRSLNNGSPQAMYKCGSTTSLDSFVFNDGLSDELLQENPQLYTNGGILPAFPFEPATAGWVVHNNRLFSTVNNYVYYSLPLQQGVAVEGSPLLYVVGDTIGGNWTGLASLDDKLILFKEDYIYACLGDGANGKGQNSSLTTPQLVNSPVGCISANSIVRTPMGIMFKSSKGIYMLDRSLQVSYIGAPVEKFNTNTVNTSTLLLKENKVKFSTAEGNILTYNYFYQSWSTESSLSFVYTTIFDGKYTGILLNGNVYQNDPTIYTRDGEYYPMTVTTPWFKPAGVQGMISVTRMQLLGEYLSPHIMNITIGQNYIDAPTDFQTFDASTMLGSLNAYGEGTWGSLTVFGGQLTSLYQFHIEPVNTQCMTFQLTFQDSFSSTTFENGSSANLLSLVVEYLPETYSYQILPTQKAQSAIG